MNMDGAENASMQDLTPRFDTQAYDERLTLLTRNAAILELGLDGVTKG
jgi:hypothetical protein